MVMFNDNIRGSWMKDIWEPFVLSLQLLCKSEIISNLKILSKTGAGGSAILNSLSSTPMPYNPQA